MNRRMRVTVIATGVWVVGLLVTASMLSVPPANVPLYIGLACIAIIPLIFGSRGYRIFGVIALAYSLMAALGEHQAGIRQKEKMEDFRQHWATNSPSVIPPKP